VLVVELYREGPKGTYGRVPLADDLPLEPAYGRNLPDGNLVEKTIREGGNWDLGFLIKNHDAFSLSLPYGREPCYVKKHESIRVRLRASAHNAPPAARDLLLQIDWDGQWRDSLDEMQAHLVITRV
jgi:hypothetical protein